jgi:hypothetical protein
MSMLFDFFVLTIVVLATGAALFLFLDPTLDILATDHAPGAVAAAHSRRIRFAVSIIVAAVFSIVEYATHRVLLSTQLNPNVSAMCDGAVNAFVGAIVAWALLSAKQRTNTSSVAANPSAS